MTLLDGLVSFAALALATTTWAMLASTARHFGPGKRPAEAPLEGVAVSLMMPLRGADPELAENLRSWATLTGVREVVFCVADADDAAMSIARTVAATDPVRVRVLHTGPIPDGPYNGKVWSLRAASAMAKADVLVVADGNARGSQAVLDALVGACSTGGAAAAFALYQGIPGPGRTLGARVEAALFASNVIPPITGGYRVARSVNLLGKASAVRADALRAVGGYDSILEMLVDDGALGRRLLAHGLRIALVPELTQVVLGDLSMAALWAHEQRWMTFHRATVPFAVVAMFTTNLLTLSGLAAGLAASGHGLSAAATGVAMLSVFATKAINSVRYGCRAGDVWVLLVAEAVLWAATLSVWGRLRTTWRGHVFDVESGGRIRATNGHAQSSR